MAIPYQNFVEKFPFQHGCRHLTGAKCISKPAIRCRLAPPCNSVGLCSRLLTKLEGRWLTKLNEHHFLICCILESLLAFLPACGQLRLIHLSLTICELSFGPTVLTKFHYIKWASPPRSVFMGPVSVEEEIATMICCICCIVVRPCSYILINWVLVV